MSGGAAAQSFRLIQFQATDFPPPAGIRLRSNLRLFVGLRGCLAFEIPLRFATAESESAPARIS
jgi:hypothetical protein